MKQFKKTINLIVILYLLGAFLSLSGVFADDFPGVGADVTVSLQNGGQMTGRIEEKTEEGIILDIGGGTITIPAGDIENVTRGVASTPFMREPRISEKEIKKRRKKTEEEVQKRLQEAIESREESYLKDRALNNTVIRYGDVHKIVVKAVLNGKIAAPFLVDTGSNLVVISPELANSLTLSYRDKNSVKMQVADGRTVDAYQINIRHITVGNSEAQYVPAVVLSEWPDNSQIKGLLGMSFFKNFDVHIDPAARTFTISNK